MFSLEDVMSSSRPLTRPVIKISPVFTTIHENPTLRAKNSFELNAKKDPAQWQAQMLTCVLMSVTCLWKNRAGGHFGVLTGTWIFAAYNLHWKANSKKPQVKACVSFVDVLNQLTALWPGIVSRNP